MINLNFFLGDFGSLQHFSPFLEQTASGISSLWARVTALKYECVVVVGYPEKLDIPSGLALSPEFYNSSILIDADGETIANYRKSFLFNIEETWSQEGLDGFFNEEIEGLGKVAMGMSE